MVYFFYLLIFLLVSCSVDQCVSSSTDSCSFVEYDPEKVLRRNFIDRYDIPSIDRVKKSLCDENYSEYWKEAEYSAGCPNWYDTLTGFYTDLRRRIKENGNWLSDIEFDRLSPVLDMLNVIVVSEDEEYDNWWLQRLRISHQIEPKVVFPDIQINLNSIEENRWNLFVGNRTYIFLPNVLALIKRLGNNNEFDHRYIGFPFEDEELLYHSLSAGILLSPSVSAIVKNSEEEVLEEDEIDKYIGRLLASQNVPISPIKGFEPDNDINILMYMDDETKIPKHYHWKYERNDLLYPVLSFGNLDPKDMIFEKIREMEKSAHLVFPFGFSGFDDTIPPHYKSCRDTCLNTFSGLPEWKVYDWMLDLGGKSVDDWSCIDRISNEVVDIEQLPLTNFAFSFLRFPDDYLPELERLSEKLEKFEGRKHLTRRERKLNQRLKKENRTTTKMWKQSVRFERRYRKIPSDILRLSLIYIYGGFYLDNDAICLHNAQTFSKRIERMYETNSDGYLTCVGRNGEFEEGHVRSTNAFFAFPRRSLFVYYMLRTWLSEGFEWPDGDAQRTGPYYYSFMLAHEFPVYVDKEISANYFGKCDIIDFLEPDEEAFLKDLDYLDSRKDEDVMCIHLYGPRLKIMHEAVDKFIIESGY